LTTCAKYRTPLRDLYVDVQVNAELAATDAFEPMSTRNEEAEHSIEMQMPFIAKVMGDRQFTIIPVLVGSLNAQRQQVRLKLLSFNSKILVIWKDLCSLFG
jgi:hypothetical protein